MDSMRKIMCLEHLSIYIYSKIISIENEHTRSSLSKIIVISLKKTIISKNIKEANQALLQKREGDNKIMNIENEHNKSSLKGPSIPLWSLLLGPSLVLALQACDMSS